MIKRFDNFSKCSFSKQLKYFILISDVVS
jgi:hypothetical protein